MKILHVITGLGIGGAEKMLLNLLAGMDRARFDAGVVSLMDRGELGAEILKLGYPLYTLNMRRGLPGPAALSRLRDAIRAFAPDLIQGWMYHGNLAALAAARFAPRTPPVVWSIHHSLYDIGSEKPLTRFLIRLSAKLSSRPAAVVHVSRAGARQHENLGFDPGKTRIVPNGFDCLRFAPPEEGWARAKASYPSLCIGLAARFHPMKDHANFLQAAAILRQRMGAARFLLAGQNIDAANAELARSIAHHGLAEHIDLLGPVADMPAFYRELDILTSSSWSEAFPSVLGEAMACGVPCVATDVGDSRLIVGETGRIVPPREPQALAAAWLELAELGAEGRRALGKQARERILAEFSLPAAVERYQSLYLQTGRP
jgi:glycosyltransferase involved in cell wall biosynthesis